MSSLVLLHRPFLGPASLRPLADALRVPAVVPDVRSDTADPQEIGDVVRRAAGTGDVVLVGHNGAGPLFPAVATRLGPRVHGLLFVDAGLPTPGRSWADTVPAVLAEQLRALVCDDRLPPWNRWFDTDPLDGLVRDPALREQIRTELPRVAAVFLDQPRPADRWDGPAGYLQLGAAYQDEAQRAETRGWPVERLDVQHLSVADEPERVASAVHRLLRRLG